MIDWLWRLFRRRAPRHDDAAYDAQLEAHARAMAHAERALPGDPVIRAERQRADQWMRDRYADRQAGRVL